MSTKPISSAQLAVTSALLSGDSGALYRIAAGLLDEGVPIETVLFDFLVAAGDQVGARWQSGDYLIAEEHVATATIETVVSLLMGSLDQPTEGAHIIVSVAEGDDHSLLSRALAAYFLFLEYRTTYVGANVVSSDLHHYLRSEGPEALVLSCAMTTHLFGARSAIRASHEAGVPVLTGGRGFGQNGVWATLLGADAWSSSPHGAPSIIETWTPDIDSAESRAMQPSADLLQALDSRSAILATAQTELRRRLPGEMDRRLAEGLDLLLGAALAAELVDDSVVLREMLQWQRSMLSAQGLDPGDQVSGSMRKALNDSLPWLGHRLSREMDATS